MEISLSKRIANWVKKQNRWVGGWEIERVVSENTNYKPSNASRRCREMESGKLSNGKTCPILFEKKEENGLTYYRWNPKESETESLIKSVQSNYEIFDKLNEPKQLLR